MFRSNGCFQKIALPESQRRIVEGQMRKPPSEPWHLSPPNSRFCFRISLRLTSVKDMGET